MSEESEIRYQRSVAMGQSTEQYFADWDADIKLQKKRAIGALGIGAVTFGALLGGALYAERQQEKTLGINGWSADYPVIQKVECAPESPSRSMLVKKGGKFFLQECATK